MQLLRSYWLFRDKKFTSRSWMPTTKINSVQWKYLTMNYMSGMFKENANWLKHCPNLFLPNEMHNHAHIEEKDLLTPKNIWKLMNLDATRIRYHQVNLNTNNVLCYQKCRKTKKFAQGWVAFRDNPFHISQQ